MALKFNPLLNIGFDNSGTGGGGGSGVTNIANVGSSPNSAGGTIAGVTLTLQPANGTNPGVLTAGVQSIGGNKTFTGSISASNFSGSSSGTNTGDVTLGTANGLSLVGQALSIGLSSSSTTGSLSSADWSAFDAKQDALTIGNLTETGSSILTITGGTGSIIGSGLTIEVQAADTSNDGYLTSADWNTFNNKQAAGNYITALTGEVTASGPGSSAATVSNAAVIAKVLTGFTAGPNSPVAATDSILQGIQKLQAQVTSGGGTVTSVDFADASATPIYVVSGNPVTSTGTLTITLEDQVANTIFAGPATGANDQPTFRTLVAADIPSISLASGVTGILPTANGGTGQNSTASFPTSGVVAVVPGAGVVKSNGSVLSVSNVSLSTEVTGILSLANGGTNSNLTATAGSVAYSTASGIAFTAVGTSGQYLASNGTSAPSWVSIPAASPGDIGETSFTAADNQSTPDDITGFTFANATVRGFDALVTIVRDNTFAEYKLRGIQKASSWELSQDFVGDSTGIVFSITNAGQIQFTSTSTGFTSLIKFRAISTSV